MATKKTAGTKSAPKTAEKMATPAKADKGSKNGTSPTGDVVKASPVKASAVKASAGGSAAPAKAATKAPAKAAAKSASKAPATASVAAAPKPAATKPAATKPAETKPVPAKATSPAKAPAAKAAPARVAKNDTPVAAPLTSSPYDKAFLKQQREALLSERARYLHSAQTYREEADSLMNDREPGDVQFDEESGEGDTLAVERERDLALSAQAQAAVDEIDAALDRIAHNTYGICRVSGREIPRERLEAIPWATERVEFKAGGLGRR